MIPDFYPYEVRVMQGSFFTFLTCPMFLSSLLLSVPTPVTTTRAGHMEERLELLSQSFCLGHCFLILAR